MAAKVLSWAWGGFSVWRDGCHGGERSRLSDPEEVCDWFKRVGKTDEDKGAIYKS